jgi:hypothetical protein
MTLYKASYITHGSGTEYRVKWFGTMKDVNAFRKEFKHDGTKGFDTNDIVDVPTNKKGLIEWLNENLNRDYDE